ncbi:uncharacterized protein F5147DRAFT_820911 [Suillus discolor]|uniref:Uncharacterized protein n=1 Tax=Suillus discolor TaxID=1912936 RepID=A0A9P7JNU2_9AGAM|nr:uncharacterized protein F5147DRAFT_820911 [Suillus discolor]KAG2093747.1 hypothetical protein F5147DRAFT_820911 [Suillus discolor]
MRGNFISRQARSFADNVTSQQLYKSLDIIHPVTGDHTGTLILAHVKYIHARKDVLTDKGVIDLAKFKPIACLGDISYAQVGDAYRITRPSWAQEEAKIQEALTTRTSL